MARAFPSLKRLDLMVSEDNHSMESSSYIKADVSTTIRVGPRDENGLVEIIDSFGAAMLDIGNAAARDSARALASIKDPRVIKYFAAALEAFGNSRAFGFSNDYPISLQAIYALSKFDDDSAMAALERAMNSPSEDIRENVATVLGSMKHPQAINLLLKMVKDENEDVRKAAQTALNERGQEVYQGRTPYQNRSSSDWVFVAGTRIKLLLVS